MAIRTVDDSSLVALGDSIRAKTGGEEPLTFPEGMVNAINSIMPGDFTIEPIVLTGNQPYGFAGVIASQYIELFGSTITTEDLGSDFSYMFKNYENETIPFEINAKGSSPATMTQMFTGATKLKQVPKMNTFKPYSLNEIFLDCHNLREIPEDIDENWDWSYLDGLTSTYAGNRSGTFIRCYSLRSIPMSFLSHGNPKAVNSYSIYNACFNECCSIDEIIGLPICHILTSNGFTGTFGCERLKEMTFALDNGQPYVANWKNQTVDLRHKGYTSYGFNENKIIGYNSGITIDKKVTDEASYQALKNDPDWYTYDMAYSRYNHNSAVNTINSLPDTSAYLAANGGSNTVVFAGAEGSATDGGAVNTLTEEEIAVAAAKGWTVTLA